MTETPERVVCAVPCLIVLICAAMILLYIRDIEGITGGPEAYENSHLYKMAAWLLMVMSIIGLSFHYVLRKVRDRHFNSYMNNDVTFGYVKAGVTFFIAVFLLIGAVANVIYALENTKILQSVMMIIQSEHSFFTSSDDEQLWNALRRVRNTEILTAIISFIGVPVYGLLAVMTIADTQQRKEKQDGTNFQKLLSNSYCLLRNYATQIKQC